MTGANRGTEGEQLPQTLSLAVAKDGSVPAVTIPPPGQEGRAEPGLCQAAPLSRQSPATARGAPACAASGLIKDRKMSGTALARLAGAEGAWGAPSGGWQVMLPELGMLEMAMGEVVMGTSSTRAHSSSGTWDQSLWMWVTHLSTLPGVFFQLQGW